MRINHYENGWGTASESAGTGGSTGLVLQVTPGRVVEKNTNLVVPGTFKAGKVGLYTSTTQAKFDNFYSVDMRRASGVTMSGKMGGSWSCKTC